MTTGVKLCLERYQINNECYAYFNWIFNDIRYKLDNYYKDNENDKTKEFKGGIYNIHEIDDPILRHIALYLVENYYEAHEYFSEHGEWRNNYACDSLNKWMDNKKSYFTHALHCKGNVQLWDETIEPLWKKLEKNFNGNNGPKGKWCKRNEVLELRGHNALGFRGHLELPRKLNPPRCYKHVPKDYKCVLPFPPNKCNLANTYTNNFQDIKSYYDECKKLNAKHYTDVTQMFAEAIANGNSLFKDIRDITFSRQVENNIYCPSFEYATPISFTPLGSKLSYRGIKKKRLRNNFNEELEYEKYERSMNQNPHRARRRNNIYYDSVRN